MRLCCRLSLAMLVFAGLASCCSAESIRPVALDKLQAIVASAPSCPARAVEELGLKAHLIDYIDFTRSDDPHDMRDQGTSKVGRGPAGTYRITAPHHHAFFSYGFRTAGRDRPVLLVIEYPDDADRVISFMTHDSMRSWLEHTSFSQETGVYTGGAMPLSGKMKYFTLVSWPQDDWSPILVLNWTRANQSAAASRMWVYAIDEFSEPAANPPEPANQRVLDAFFPLSFLATRDNFGWKSPKSVEHMADYMKLIGVGRVTMMVYYAPGLWGPACTIPSWDTGEKKDLDDILSILDRVGGIGLIAGIVTDGMYGKTVAGGKAVADMPPKEAREVILKGLGEFVDRYGKYKSLRGIALGSMETIGFYDMLQAKGIADDVVAYIEERRPDWDVITYVGNIHLQVPYFGGGYGSPTTWDVLNRWEQSPKPWTQHLAAEVLADWKLWKHLPSDLKKIPGLQVYEQFAPDDHRLHDVYPAEDPRQGFYFDVVRSQGLSADADTPYAAIFSTFTEGHIGLAKDLNFWYSKYWTGPDLNPAAPNGLFGFAQAMAARDRLAFSAGTWSVKYFGLEPAMRRFAAAFRSLPPIEMTEVEQPVDAVVVRWAAYKGKGYTSIVNRTPFDQTLTVGGREVAVPPYQLSSLVDDETGGPPRVAGKASEAYRAWVAQRIASYRKVLDQVRTLDAAAAPKVYTDVADAAARELEAGNTYAADVALGYGLAEELKLRRDILTPPEMAAPRVASAPPMNGDLDAWPKEASDIRAEDGSNLVAHLFFPTSWSGPDDLSLRMRLAHDGEKLYIGLEVRDQLVTVDTRDSRDNAVNRPDGLTIKLSTDGKYLQWRSQDLDPNVIWQIPAPIEKPELTGTGRAGFTWTCRRTKTGYVVEGSAPLSELGVEPGGSLGLIVAVADVDNTKNLMHSSNWARKQALQYPNEPNFVHWKDARNCGKLVLGK